MDRGYIAEKSIAINAPIADVWDALVNPATIKQYMFGADAVSEWKEGSPIVFRGEWEGVEYEDKGVILRFEPSFEEASGRAPYDPALTSYVEGQLEWGSML